MHMQDEVLTSQSQTHAAKLQPHKHLATKSCDRVHSGINNDKPADSILAAHSPQQVTNGQSNEKQEQTAHSAEQAAKNTDLRSRLPVVVITQQFELTTSQIKQDQSKRQGF